MYWLIISIFAFLLIISELILLVSHNCIWNKNKLLYSIGWFSRKLRKLAKGKHEIYFLYILSPILVLFVIIPIIDLSRNYNVFLGNSLHYSTYIVFGFATIVGALVTFMVFLRLVKRDETDLNEIRKIYYNVINDAKEGVNSSILFAAPNPGQLEYGAREYVKTFRRIIESVRSKKGIIRLATLPWCKLDGRIDEIGGVKYIDISGKDINGLKSSMLGLFLKEFYDNSSQKNGWHGYIGNVEDLLQILIEGVIDNYIELYWIAKPETVDDIKDMVILYNSDHFSYLGTYDLKYYRSNLLNVIEQKDTIANLYDQLLEQYGKIKVRCKNN